MKRSELSKEKQKAYDNIVEEMMNEIANRNPEQYEKAGQLDGEASQIYQETFEKYRPKLEALFV